jgi:hypothetical protein
MSWSDVTTAIPTYGSLLAAIVTAVATYFLWRVTDALAAETKRMVDAGSQPHIVATLEPSRVSMIHLNLNVDNTGSGTAYDIQVLFEPPLPSDRQGKDRTTPLQKISILKPGQGVSSFLCEYARLEGREFRVTTSWRRDAARPDREANTYTLDMAFLKGISRLGGADPLTEIADQVKKIREDWQYVGRGTRRIQIDGFSGADRLHERRLQERQFRRMQQERNPAPSPE